MRGIRRLAGRRTAAPFAAILGLMLLAGAASAWEHEASKVDFTEYREGIIEELQEAGRPYFLLFSAEWCHWCHEFGKNTLTDDDVAHYLNAHYSNVFIDADIHSAANVKYRATGLPFTVFLNPDGSSQFRYAGTLYADDFLSIIKQIRMNVVQGLSVEEDRSNEEPYEPPGTLAPEEVANARETFLDGILEKFDPVEQGLGKGEKALYPRAFLYLIGQTEGETHAQAVSLVRGTVERALERIYDPLEGGFFRYAETRDWKVPHYEKMADLNAGAALLLLRLNDVAAAPRLMEAADRTLGYLQKTLYDTETGVFLSFQEADTHYYAIRTSEARAKARRPSVIEKVFVDRLAGTVTHLLDVLPYRRGDGLREQVVSSLDFVARRLEASGSLGRYYALDTGKWAQQGTLQDYALVAQMFLAASVRLESARYRDLARVAADAAIARFLDARLGVLVDPSLGDTGDAEFLMEMNGLLAGVFLGLEDDARYAKLVDGIVTYFSLIGEVLDDRLWDGKDWEFTERYVPYLLAAKTYLARTRTATRP